MSSMKCTIPGVNLKVFGRAIQSLSKIGDELYFEPLEDGLYLRTVNSCRSAYGYFQFSPTFFLHYVDGSSGSAGRTEEEDCLRCKIGMKSVMTVFKSLSTIDKTVEKCRISLNMTEARLIFQMHCRHGIVKTHNLTFIECESLQAVFSKDLCPNKITARPKLLCDAVLNFQNNQEEITLILRPDFLALKNYVEDEPDKTKVIHTELTLDPDEFDQYQVGVDTEVTFCLKELRAILAFVDITDLPLSLHFESAGRPVTLTINSDLSFEANFVLATVADTDGAQQSRPQHTQGQGQGQTSKRPRNASQRVEAQTSHRSVNGVGGHRADNTSRHADTTSARNQPEDEMDDNDDDELSRVMDITAPNDSIAVDESVPQARLDDRSRARSMNDTRTSTLVNSRNASRLAGDISQNHSHHQSSAAGVSSSRSQAEASTSSRSLFRGHTTSREHEEMIPPPDPPQPQPNALDRLGLSLRDEESSSPDITSPQIPLQIDTMNSRIGDESGEDDSDDDEIPGTPPSKKFRALLFGTQSSTQPSQSQRKDNILALDSDDDT